MGPNAFDVQATQSTFSLIQVCVCAGQCRLSNKTHGGVQGDEPRPKTWRLGCDEVRVVITGHIGCSISVNAR